MELQIWNVYNIIFSWVVSLDKSSGILSHLQVFRMTCIILGDVAGVSMSFWDIIVIVFKKVMW